MPLRERNSASSQQKKRKVASKRKTVENKIRKEMSQLFLDQIYLEKEVEKLKMDLAHRIDFTCMAAFQIFNFRSLEQLNKNQFSESLFSYIGNSFFNREQEHLIFIRYDDDMDGQISYREWCSLVVPRDRVLSGLLLGRAPGVARMSQETQEVFKRLLRAHLNLEQAHEYLRQRLTRTRGTQKWTLKEIFDVLDHERKGSLTVFDLEKIIINQRKGGACNIVEEIELLVALFDRSD